jgi:peptidoglycan/LPS O-acetylase OafA/YrhL
MKYRKEVDGLRALAILPVIFFHADISLFKGGFVGVDVFFVISGYLITSIIIDQLGKGGFSIINFYERRARRILPALFFMMLVCLPFSWFSLFPSEMRDFSQTLVAVSIFLSNIIFWLKSGYFEPAVDLKPLLHTWSLAVEEQYYVIFPIILMLFWKIGRRYILIGLGFIFISSLIYAEWAVHEKPMEAFYLLPSRAWELLLGAFVAFYFSEKKNQKINPTVAEIGGWLGLILILWPVFVYNKETVFPGLHAVPPALGAAMIILFSNQDNTIGRFIGNRVFVGIGLISYSLYLWHQPMFAYAKTWGFTTAHDKNIYLFLIILIFALSVFSWKYVEQPFRSEKFASRRSIFTLSVSGIIFFVLLGLYGYKKNGDLGQISTEQRDFLNHFENNLPEWRYFEKEGIYEKYRFDCDFKDIAKHRRGDTTLIPVPEISKSCYTAKNKDASIVFIWGDSHAQHLYHGLNTTLPETFEVLQVAASGCFAKIKLNPDKSNYCEYSNWFAFDSIKKLKPDTVLIAQIMDHDHDQMEKMSTELKSIGVKNVFFTGTVPRWTPNLPSVIARLMPDVPQRTFLGMERNDLKLDDMLKEKTKNAKNFQYISLLDYFCNKDGCLLHHDADIASSVTTWDGGHLTPVGSYHLAKNVLTPIIVAKHLSASVD